MTDFLVTFAEVVEANEAHGFTGGAHYLDGSTIQLLDCLNEPSGWNLIRVDPVTQLCSLSDLMAALGYGLPCA